MDDIKFYCECCGQSLLIACEHAGTEVKCPYCDCSIKVPVSSDKPPVIQPVKRPQTNPYVVRSFDEFTDTTTYHHSTGMTFGPGGGLLMEVLVFNRSLRFHFGIRRVRAKDFETLLFDCTVQNTETWFNPTFVTFNCDQVNHTSEWNQQSYESRCVTDILNDSFVSCCETGYFPISLDVLRAICDSEILKIRISGSAASEHPSAELCRHFQKICRQFYNGVFDPEAFLDAVKPPEMPEPRAPVAVNKKRKRKSGCFIATAAMGSADDPTVKLLCQLRDDVLLKSWIGEVFVDAYYQCSPPFASWLYGRPLACKMVQLGLIPVACMSKILLHREKTGYFLWH